MLSKRTKQWQTSLAAVGMTCVILGSVPGWAGDPVSAAYCQENDQIFWFVTVTDTHIGMRGSRDTDNLSWVVHEGKSVINPSFIVLSGDITDSTDGNLFGWPNGPHQSEWNEYRATLDMANTGINAGNFFDIPGNHDAYSDGDFSYYLNNSVQGQVTGRTQASWTREFDYGKYHFLGANTSANDGRSFSIFFPYGDYAGLDTGELSYLESELSQHTNSDLTLVFGHHPIEDTGHSDDTWLFYGAPEFAALMEGYGASSYTYGHTHRFSEAFFTSYAITPGVFYININSLGESSDNHFNVTAIDCNGISMVTQTINRWPVVMITTPMDRNLGKNAHPLLGYTVPNGTGNPLRALLFDPNTSVCTAEYRIDNSTIWHPMSRVVTNPNLWETSWDSSGLNEGEHTVEVRATGSEGAIRTDTIAVYVDAGTTNEPPVANATVTPLSGTAPLEVDFNGTASTDDGTITSYLWNFGDNSTSIDPITTHTYPNEGTYSVTLTVTDNEGVQNTSASITIEVTSVPNESPVAKVTVDTAIGSAPLTVVFDGSSSTDDSGNIDSYDWNFGDGDTGSGPSVTHTYQNAGEFTTKLTVTDDAGASDEATVLITATNTAPEASFSATPTSGDIPLTVKVDAVASSDFDGTIDQYEWNFGDGTTAQGVTASHIYTEAGDFTITLIVTDNVEATDSVTTVISAIDSSSLNAPTGLTASVSGSTVSLSWTDNSDEEGFVVQRAPKIRGKYTFTDENIIGTTDANVSTFSDDSGLGRGTYAYRVYGKIGTDTSDFSNVVMVRLK